MNIVNEIIENFKTNKELYIGEKVTISEHMIQTAMLAEKDNSSKSLVCACLLHDYGHFIVKDPDLLVSKSLDGKHEDLGYEFLKKYFVSDVIEPIKLHVDAKRYLCRNKSYYEHLSKASIVSLDLQGGFMTDDEAKKRNLEPLANIVSWATCGVEPSLMGSGPIPSSTTALKNAGW